MANKRAAFVQTCWTFTNSYESMLTWSQKVNLDFHFEIEQRARWGGRKRERERERTCACALACTGLCSWLRAACVQPLLHQPAHRQPSPSAKRPPPTALPQCPTPHPHPRHFLGNFFNFNGTAGVWRIQAIDDAGGRRRLPPRLAPLRPAAPATHP
jgi:hypothetical protein